VAQLFYGLSDWLDFPWLFARITDTDDEDVWLHRATRGLAEDLARAHCRLVRLLCKTGATHASLDALGVKRAPAEEVACLIADLKDSHRVGPAALQVVVRELRCLCQIE
jgi:NAD-specific glutamate dehydrogenase